MIFFKSPGKCEDVGEMSGKCKSGLLRKFVGKTIVLVDVREWKLNGKVYFLFL